jgi:(heptosyl)LPS beta-1,4-glucosyltransferase
LFNRKYGNFNERIIHEYVELDGETGKINECIEHYTYTDIEEHLTKMRMYAELSALQKFEAGNKGSKIKAIVNYVMKFMKMYFIKLGFLDGKYGLKLSVNSAFGVYLKYIKLWEMNRKKES